jgi:hypothetical protein
MKQGVTTKMALRKYLTATVSLLLAMAMITVPGAIGGTDQVAADPCPQNWNHQWTLDMGSVFICASPTLSDIDGDSRSEILVGNTNGYFYCIDAGGSIRWMHNTGASIQSTPLAVDCDGDGTKEIFVGSDNGYLYGFNHLGQSLSQWGWPKFTGLPGYGQGVFGSPASGDLDGDGDLEIVVGSWGQLVKAWHYQGPEVFTYLNADSIWSSPACEDIDLDGKDEVIIGADCWSGPHWPWPRGGLLYVLEGDGSIKQGFPKCLPQVIWSSPAIADLDMDGFPDIVVGTGNFWQNTNPGADNYLSYADGNHVYAFNYKGENLPGWPVNTQGDNFASPAVADIDGDGRFEVACTSIDNWLYVWEHNGALKWKRQKWDCDKLGSPAIADINGDGQLDVLCGDSWDLTGYDAQGNMILFQSTDGIIFSAPAAGDIDNDGLVEVVVSNGAGSGNGGKISCWEGGAYNASDNSWPKFRKEENNRASYPHQEIPDLWPPEQVKSRSYLAEGYTGTGFHEYILMMNPQNNDLPVQIRYLLSSGLSVVNVINIPAASRTTVPVNNTIAGQDVSSTVISCLEGLIAERSLYFDYSSGGGTWPGGHDVMGAEAPQTEWYFAEGCTRPGFNTWLCIQNPGDSVAHVALDYLCGDGANEHRDLTVNPRSRYTVAVHQPGLGIGAHNNAHGDVSIKVSSDQPIVAERPIYFNYDGAWPGGHNVMGAESPQPDWYFAEGCTRPGFHTWLCLQNPGDQTTRVSLDYLCGDGVNERRELTIGPRSRATVAVHQPGLGIGTHDSAHGDVSIKVSSDQPIVAERPIYFNYNGAWPGGHNVVGSPAPRTGWIFAEGCTRPGFHTWLCLQNPGDEPARVFIDYLCGDGNNVHKEITVNARSRATIAVHGNSLGIGVHDSAHGDVSIKITSDQPIMAERPVYFLYGGDIPGGHNTGGFPI